MSRRPENETLPPYEERAPVWGYFWALGFVASLVAIVMLVALLFAHWDRIEVFSRYLGGKFDPFSWRQAPPVAKKPRLQVDEILDIDEYRKRERDILTSYRWVDRGRGIVQIPIDRAMEMTVQSLSVSGRKGGEPSDEAPRQK